MKIVREALFFSFVGGVGFLVDTGILIALAPYFGPFIGRGFSFITAVIITWYLNRVLTFRGRPSGLNRRKELAVYFSLMLVGGAVNYLVFTWLVLSYPYFQNRLYFAVAAGSIAGMFFNFSSARLSLFRST